MRATHFLRIVDALLDPAISSHTLADRWGVHERTARRQIGEINTIRQALQQQGITIRKESHEESTNSQECLNSPVG